jgi:hypothetical protein
MTPVSQIAPRNPRARVSSDSAWPIRRADGRTPAEVRPEYQRKEM